MFAFVFTEVGFEFFYYFIFVFFKIYEILLETRQYDRTLSILINLSEPIKKRETQFWACIFRRTSTANACAPLRLSTSSYANECAPSARRGICWLWTWRPAAARGRWSTAANGFFWTRRRANYDDAGRKNTKKNFAKFSWNFFLGNHSKQAERHNHWEARRMHQPYPWRVRGTHWDRHAVGCVRDGWAHYHNYWRSSANTNGSVFASAEVFLNFN